MDNRFEHQAMDERNPRWKECIARTHELYKRENDIRTEFGRDYTRILHSQSYRRLKHKTQVFFHTNNDHVCTRIEHVAHVESVSYTIAKKLGLNTELTKAIATGHDLGHAPFGHHGEVVLNNILSEFHLGEFWHEKNGLRVVDSLDLLEDTDRCRVNLDLTYAVRDGIICHCGEIDENHLYPRETNIDLNTIAKENRCQPFTWEACIVKVSDKIAYLGRDMEDALLLKMLTLEDKRELYRIAKEHGHKVINTSVIMHDFIIDLVNSSSVDRGICLSNDNLDLMNQIKDYNYRKIYHNERLKYYQDYSTLIITTIFKELHKYYDGADTLQKLKINADQNFLISEFFHWIILFCTHPEAQGISIRLTRYTNEKIYGDLKEEAVYVQAIIDFIAGMTDNYAIKCYDSIISF